MARGPGSEQKRKLFQPCVTGRRRARAHPRCAIRSFGGRGKGREDGKPASTCVPTDEDSGRGGRVTATSTPGHHGPPCAAHSVPCHLLTQCGRSRPPTKAKWKPRHSAGAPGPVADRMSAVGLPDPPVVETETGRRGGRWQRVACPRGDSDSAYRTRRSGVPGIRFRNVFPNILVLEDKGPGNCVGAHEGTQA